MGATLEVGLGEAGREVLEHFNGTILLLLGPLAVGLAGIDQEGSLRDLGVFLEQCYA